MKLAVDVLVERDIINLAEDNKVLKQWASMYKGKVDSVFLYVRSSGTTVDRTPKNWKWVSRKGNEPAYGDIKKSGQLWSLSSDGLRQLPNVPAACQ